MEVRGPPMPLVDILCLASPVAARWSRSFSAARLVRLRIVIIASPPVLTPFLSLSSPHLRPGPNLVSNRVRKLEIRATPVTSPPLTIVCCRLRAAVSAGVLASHPFADVWLKSNPNPSLLGEYQSTRVVAVPFAKEAHNFSCFTIRSLHRLKFLMV